MTTEPPPPGGNSAEPAKRRWNVLWIIIGSLLYLAAMGTGEALVLKLVIEADPELYAAYEEISELASTQKEIPEHDKERLRTVFVSSVPLWGSITAMILLSGLLVGAIVGIFSRGILEGAAVMGLGAVVMLVMEGEPVVAIIAGPFNAGLGALGAFVGRLLYQRARRGREQV